MAVVGEMVGYQETRRTVELNTATTSKAAWIEAAKGQNVFVKRTGGTETSDVLVPPKVDLLGDDDLKPLGRLENAWEQNGKLYGACETVGLLGHALGSETGAFVTANYGHTLRGGGEGKLKLSADATGFGAIQAGNKANMMISWDTREN